MKKIILIAITGLFTISGFAQTTATNFTVNDCAGVSHDLFTELDAGKVIVLDWVMPCASCISPSITAYNTAQSFSSSHPGRVLFYMADDYANSSCASLNTWATSNNMPNSTRFSNAAIKMMDYGSTGMPKLVVLGGTSHTVYYNADDSFNAAAIQTAITNALNSTSVPEQKNELSSVSVFPNPSNASASLSYVLSSAGDVQIDLFNLVGEKVKSVFSGKQAAGEQRTSIDSSKLSGGLYFIKLSAGRFEKTVMLSVAH